MSAFGWNTDPDQNGAADPSVPAMDGTAARQFPEAARGIMAGVAMLAADQGGALVSTGAGDVYEVQTTSGLAPGPGVMIGFFADRAAVAEPALAVDGYGPAPWRDAGGAELAPGAVRKGEFQLVVWDGVINSGAPGWRRVNPGATDLAVLNAGAILAALASILPTTPPPSPGKLWFNNGEFAVTTAG